MSASPANAATLAVLAGGEGRRMGTPKAWLTLAGRPILERLIDAVGWPGPTLLVTSPGRSHPPGADCFDREVLDVEADLGPLQGISTALAHAETAFAIVIPVDMPHASASELRWMLDQLAEIEDGAAVMMSRLVDGQPRLEPLPLALHVERARPLVASSLARGARSVAGLASSPGVRVLQCPALWPSTFWTNLNHPADRDAFEAAEEGANSA